jgi:hypothetical protein
MQRSLDYLRKQRDYQTWVLEKRIWTKDVDNLWQPGHLQDMAGFDIFCWSPNHKPLLVQVTSSSNHAARVAKLLSLPSTEILHASHLIEVHSWGPRVKDGKDWWCGRIERLELGLAGCQFVRVDERWSRRLGARKPAPPKSGARPLYRDLYDT